MDGLRWLLLITGLLVIAGVYLYSRRERAKPKENTPKTAGRIEPTLGDDDPGARIDATIVESTPLIRADARGDDDPDVDDSGDAPEYEADDDRANVPEKIVALRVVARDRGAFRGDELILSLRGIGMRHGRFGIFHRIDGDDEDRTVFSAASLVEPGSFDLQNIAEQEIPGISLFAVLPGPVEGAEAFDMMVEAARTLAQSLDGELLDESGSTLSIQRERYLREEIIAYEHSIKVA